MELFNIIPTNLLPYDGEVIYYGKVLPGNEATNYMEILMRDIAWKNDEAVIFGKHFITKRKVAWYGDERFSYTYSNITKEALPWTPELLVLKNIAEKLSGAVFNSCLLNLYHSGEEGMAWHSDDEKALRGNAGIASMSFGAERKFSFKHKRTGQKIDILLEAGSLLMMKADTQTNWLHRLPPTKKVQKPRINLTFRTMNIQAS
jgi:alkylated DNA repair dioxygenase AlkB